MISYYRRLLFICTANMCRSPLAQWVFHAKLSQKSSHLAKTMAIHSAGTHADSRYSIDSSIAQLAQSKGYPCPASQQATRLTQSHFNDYDLLIVACQKNQQFILQNFQPKYSNQVVLLMQYASKSIELDVPDPYQFGYHPTQMLDMIEDACEGLACTVLDTHTPHTNC